MKKALTLQGAKKTETAPKYKLHNGKQMLGDEEVSLSSEYIALTIDKEEPHPVKLEDELLITK